MSNFKLPNLNRVSLVGRLLRDPEFKQNKNGVSVLEARLAGNNAHRDSEGDWQDEVVFIDFVVYDRLADLCEQFLHKGSAVLIEGRLQGVPFDLGMVRIEADRVQFLDKTR